MTDLTDFIPNLNKVRGDPEPLTEKCILLNRGRSFEVVREMAIAHRKAHPGVPVEWVKEKDETYALMRIENGSNIN